MSSKKDLAQRLAAFNAKIRASDGEVTDEVADNLELLREPSIEFETIVMRKLRPVLAIQNDEATLDFKKEEDSQVWKDRLTKSKPLLGPAIKAVGRVEVEGHPDFTWLGTGWLVHENILVTNRHVAEEFATRRDAKFVFQAGLDGDMTAGIDFLQEIGRDDKLRFEIKSIRYIEGAPGLDIAFLEVEQTGGKLATPIPLTTQQPVATPAVATIGYPAYDSRIPEPDLMEQIYGDVYDKKRLAPGAITSVDDQRVLHNCTTLGGNSGSVVLDLQTGEALGLHFSGTFMKTNYAVRADLVKQRLDALLAGKLPTPEGVGTKTPTALRRPREGNRQNAQPRATTTSTSITIPLTVTVSLGEAATGSTVVTSSTPATSRRQLVAPSTTNVREDIVEAVSKPEDYADREGYLADFLGKNHLVELPDIGKGAEDIVTFGNNESVLKYEHFSVVMNKSRRMCFYSACNIDGERSKSSTRGTWRYDPRIPQSLQIKGECYGNPPKFSRGHMTRREDPCWGTPSMIQRGSDDSMHVTNTVPQMQSFNAPIWLGLEDYALQNARRDDMKISVFTGPYFEDDDPVKYKVKIPVTFWKIIAFIHDETKQLCATGYEMSQEGNLEVPEFVYGNYRSPQLNLMTQVPIASIEFRAGLKFGDLAELDPLAREGVGNDEAVPLQVFEQIRFV